MRGLLSHSPLKRVSERKIFFPDEGHMEGFLLMSEALLHSRGGYPRAGSARAAGGAEQTLNLDPS